MEAKTSDALADAMLAYCRDPDRAAADGRRAHASLARLEPERFADRWWSVYEETMPGRRRRVGP